MSSVTIACPQCSKRQPFTGEVPADGRGRVCVFCQAALKLPAGAAPPLPDFDTLGLDDDVDQGMPLPEDFGPSGTIAVAHGETPGFESLDPIEELDPESPEVSLDGIDFSPHLSRDHSNLPAAREDMPMPGDLPVSRDDAPGLPVSRQDMPMPGDFLASRDAVPRPGDLPAPRESMPRPDDYLASRDSMPRPDDLLAPLGSEQLPGNLPVPSARSNARPSPRPGAPPMAEARRAPPAPLAFDPFAEDIPEAPSSPLEALDLGDGAPRANGQATASSGNFGLELEAGAASSEPAPGPRPLAFNIAAATAAANAAGAARDDGYEALTPITRRQAMNAVEDVRPPRRRLFMIVGAAGGLLMLATAGFLVLEARRSEPRPEEVLGSMTADLVRDHYPAYQRTADKLLEATGNHPEAVGLRAAAAENLLVAFLARGGERSKLSQAEQIVAALPSDGKFNPHAARARALLAVAKGKTVDLAAQLGAEQGTPEANLVVALRDVAAGKREQAATSLRQVIAARPDQLVARYLLGRMLEESSPAEAKKEYQAVVARSPDHFGAALGLVRLLATPAERMAAARALIDKKPAGVPRAEIADGHVAVGRASAALGLSADAAAAYAKAIGADPQNASANLALGESQLNDGHFAEALARFLAAGPAALKTPAGKFGLGGALIATGKTEAGLDQVRQAAQDSPKDPRGLYFTGFAAEVGTRPDREMAAQSYRAALALDRSFLPASLRLAALIQRDGKPEDALTVLKQAEEAGAPAAALQLAWGQALILAKEPARAEEVYRKAVATTPTEIPPHVGLAAALSAQGNREAARQVLEKAVAAMPDAIGLREPLAAVDVALGRKDEAMTLYRAEIATGRAALGTRVAMAKLALDVGRLDEAQSELDKVIDENPATPGALFTLARVWEARHDLNRALQEYRRAQRFESTPELSLAFGRALLQGGKENEAMIALDAAVSLPEGLIERGAALYRKGDYERALADFQQASKLAPREARAWTLRGMSHDKLGETDKAADAWKVALKLAPDDAEAHYRLGRFEHDKGRVASALEHLRKAAAHLREKPDWEAELYFQLGTAEATGGSKGAALTMLQKYLDTAPADAPARPDVERQVARLRGR